MKSATRSDETIRRAPATGLWMFIHTVMILVIAAPAWAAVQVTVVASPDPVRAGEMLDVKITVTNDGTVALSNVVVNLTYPDGLNSLSNSNFEGTCPATSCSAGQIAAYTAGTIAPGKGVTFVLAPRVASGTANGTIIPFDVDVLVGGNVEASTTTDVIVDSTRSLNLALAEDRNPVMAGDRMTYTVTYGVPSGGGSPGASLSVPLPTGTSFIAASDGGTMTGGAVEWSLGNLNPGAVGQRTIFVEVDEALPAGSILSTVAIFADLTESVVMYHAATAVVSDVGLDIRINASPDPARPAQTQDIQLTVTNTGPFDRTGVELRLEVPDHTASLSNSNFDGACPGTSCSVQQIALINIGTLPVGKSRTFMIPFRMASATVNGTVVVFQGYVRDSAGERRRGGSPLAVSSVRTLELGVAEDRSAIVPGARLTYELTWGVLETGSGILGATLRMPIPAGTSLVSASDGGTVNDGVVEWSLGNLNPGAVGQRTMIVEVGANVSPGTILETQADLRDSPGLNVVRYRSSTAVQSETPLEIRVIASPDPARHGHAQHIRITVANSGPFDRTGVEVRVEYPDGLNSLSNSFFDGACGGTSCSAQQPAVFNIGTLPAGEGRAFVMPVVVASGTTNGTVIRFKASVRDSTGEMRRSGSAMAVSGTRNLELVMAEDRDPVVPGELLTYSISYGASASGVTGTTLRVPVPAGTSFVAASDGGMHKAGMVEWAIGSLNPGQSGKRLLTVQVDTDTPVGSIISAQATFEDASMNAVRFQNATRVQPELPLKLSVIASPDPVRPGETLFLEMTVSNTGVFDRTGVVLRMEYPSGLTTLSNSNFLGLCQGTSCSAQNTGSFNVGTLAAGQGRTFTMQLLVAGATPDGSAIALFADVSDNTGDVRRSGTGITVDAARTLDLAMRESNEPIAPGGSITYTLTYGAFETTSGAPETTLRFAPPAGATVDEISTGGMIIGEEIVWFTDSLGPGQGGERTVRVTTDPDTPLGTILPAAGWIESGSALINRVRYQTHTRIESPSPLDAEIIVAPCAAQPGTTLDVLVSVRNTTGFDRTGVVLYVEYPDGLNNLSNSAFGGDCQGTSCTVQNQAFFNIGTLAAGQTVSFPMPPVIASGTPRGTVIKFNAFATDGTGFMSRDSDAVFVGFDYEPPTKGDFNNDGVVNVLDLLILIGAWGTCADPDACPQDLNCDGVVNVKDLLVLINNWG